MKHIRQRNERVQARQPFLWFSPHVLKRKSDIIAEALRPCSRFKSSLSWSEQMDFKIAALMGRFDIFDKDAFVLTEGTPPNWQILLNYLRTEGITNSERFAFGSARTDMPKTFSVRLSPRVGTSDTDGREVSRHGFGSTASVEESMSRAVGELLERYFLTVYRRAELYKASYREAKAGRTQPLNIFEPNDYLPWQKEMFPMFARTEERPLTWVRGREILSGRDALIPAELVYWNYQFEQGEMVLAEPNTNGGAGHFTREEAILSSLLELIQRDGFLIHWLNNLSPKRMDPSTIVDREIKDFLLYLRRYRLDYHFLNTTTDVGVPSCVCVLVDEAGKDPIITLGGAAGFSLKELILQSAGEALAVHGSVSSRPAHALPHSYTPFTDRRISRDERLSVWRGRMMQERFKFFLRGPPQSFEGFMGEARWHTSPEKRLAYILGNLKKLGAGYEAYAFEVAHPVLKTLGFHVVKTVVPRLMHLYLNEHMATLDAPRLRDVPAKLGYTPAETLNPWPHPFP